MSQKALTIAQLAQNHSSHLKANDALSAKKADDAERRKREETYNRELATVTQKIETAKLRGLTSFNLRDLPCRKLYDELLEYYDPVANMDGETWTFYLKEKAVHK